MSEYWGLHCKTCGISTDHDINHGEEKLRGLVRATQHIKAALDADKSGYLEFRVMGYDWSNITDFAVYTHAGHELELESETGRKEQIEITQGHETTSTGGTDVQAKLTGGCINSIDNIKKLWHWLLGA